LAEKKVPEKAVLIEPEEGSLLIVDDEAVVREVLLRWLSEEGFTCEGASSVAEASDAIRRDSFTLVLCDIFLPDGSGMELLEKNRPKIPDLSFVMVTGFADLQTALEAIRKGAFGYILKPLHREDVIFGVLGALHRRRLEIENRLHRERLEMLVAERRAAIERATERLRRSRQEALRVLGAAIDARDYGTERHAYRVARLSSELGKRYGMKGDELAALEQGAYLHDIGKIAVPDRVLLKPGPLDEDEWRIMLKHPDTGFRMLSGLELHGDALGLVRHHHERWDGSGYPMRLRGDEIPLSARVFAVADAFDAMTHNRPYRTAMHPEQALEEISRQAGRHFAPDFAEIFVSLPRDLLARIGGT